MTNVLDVSQSCLRVVTKPNLYYITNLHAHLTQFILSDIFNLIIFSSFIFSSIDTEHFVG